MTRDEILDMAKDIINGDRQSLYGNALERHSDIAIIWGSIIGFPIAPFQVGLMMAGLKMARAAHNPTHEDSWIDACGYLALAAEMATQDRPTVRPTKGGNE